ncbi:transcriptional regulator, ArsR family [Clostridium amylolyticum]|uniref:Transcriptional regulator, ArsR family n=1 Tax=Clostridium amylolyticum TaxID=1121298 RepID=A0A1M6P0R1_9CLOT|nr:metalloregulator ArsR/SmtB family transcription factor [Clostridium amylolyticum]SHK01577.1 transcriptional regulator, ArsR family [Clostridium amylolyticum]
MNNLTNFFKLLSDETRLRILILLYHKKLCVCEMCGIMNESQPKVSKHLGKLRDMGFVKDERQEQFIYYYLTIENELFKDILQGIAENVEDYPVIKNDIKNINSTEKYLEACKRRL